jgi:hypothetical protein
VGGGYKGVNLAPLEILKLYNKNYWKKQEIKKNKMHFFQRNKFDPHLFGNF